MSFKRKVSNMPQPIVPTQDCGLNVAKTFFYIRDSKNIF